MQFLFRLGRLASLWFALIVAAAPAGKEVTVWALTESKVYHCPGSRWYKTGKGKEISECLALKDGYKPAFGQRCGSVCPAR
jgi:hypothetical protein